MATKYALDHLDAKTHKWETDALFSDIFPIETLADVGATLWGYVTEEVADLAIINMDTGEIEWSASTDESCEPWDSWDDVQTLLEKGYHFVNGEPMLPE